MLLYEGLSNFCPVLSLKYWREWFPRLPSYQTFVRRLNQLEPTFQTVGALLSGALAVRRVPECDHLIDPLPVMLARHGHSYRARVGREVADIGFCAAKKTRFHGVRLQCIAQRRTNRLPLPAQMWLCAASHHDSKAFIEQRPEVHATEGSMTFRKSNARHHPRPHVTNMKGTLPGRRVHAVVRRRLSPTETR